MCDEFSNLKFKFIFIALFSQQISQTIEKAQSTAMGEASNLVGKLNLGGFGQK